MAENLMDTQTLYAGLYGVMKNTDKRPSIYNKSSFANELPDTSIEETFVNEFADSLKALAATEKIKE